MTSPCQYGRATSAVSSTTVKTGCLGYRGKSKGNMSDYLRSALGYLNGATGGNEYVGQTLEINNVKLRVTRLIAEGESIFTVHDYFSNHGSLGRHLLPLSRAIHVNEIDRNVRSVCVECNNNDAKLGKKARSVFTLCLARHPFPDMCQTCVLTCGQTRACCEQLYFHLFISCHVSLSLSIFLSLLRWSDSILLKAVNTYAILTDLNISVPYQVFFKLYAEIVFV